MGQVQPLIGTVNPGAKVQIGYFAQAHESLNPDSTVLEELLRHKELPMTDARRHLAQFLFRKDTVFKQISMLSGGERGRLALAILALEGANFLLLDEPTNHLDIPAQEVLQEVLENFEGTILLVSHDRYLVDRLATQIWDLQEGHLTVFEGDYAAYLEARSLEAKVAR
jgi:ATP-binding cassette subfamily F protein 3